jgi:acrylyl-CoA reductase (NADPH)
VRAFVVTERDGSVFTGVHELSPTSHDDHDVRVRVEYSSVNFKDALVASAPSRVRRVPSLVGGVDAAGVVVDSSDSNFTIGERVVALGGELGVARDGGFAEELYAPSHLLTVLPATLTTRDAMIIGTAGYTALASVLALEDRGLEAGACVLVTGATGGVGSQAVTYLARRGYEVVASTGSPDAHEWLRALGAYEVIGRDDIADRPGRVLASERWDGAIDCVGGSTLHEILRSLRYGAAVAASGLVGSAELATNVYPFITRNVALLGIDAVEATPSTRRRVWDALGVLASTITFDSLVDSTVGLSELAVGLETIRSGATRGRILIDLALN